MTLDADATSLHVIEGTGGMKSLDEDDRANIRQTIDDEILKRVDIRFRSTAVERERRRTGRPRRPDDHRRHAPDHVRPRRSTTGG